MDGECFAIHPGQTRVLQEDFGPTCVRKFGGETVEGVYRPAAFYAGLLIGNLVLSTYGALLRAHGAESPKVEPAVTLGPEIALLTSR